MVLIAQMTQFLERGMDFNPMKHFAPFSWKSRFRTQVKSLMHEIYELSTMFLHLQQAKTKSICNLLIETLKLVAQLTSADINLRPKLKISIGKLSLFHTATSLSCSTSIIKALWKSSLMTVHCSFDPSM